MTISVRRYLPQDAAATLDVFSRAIHVTAAADYSPDQLAVWAPAEIDADAWARKQMARNGVVAEIDGAVAGFSDVDPNGYIHMMFVAPEHGRSGVASSLMAWIVVEASRLGVSRLSTHASESARAFFEKHGFTVEEHRCFVRSGVPMTNYSMTRPLT